MKKYGHARELIVEGMALGLMFIGWLFAVMVVVGAIIGTVYAVNYILTGGCT